MLSPDKLDDLFYNLFVDEFMSSHIHILLLFSCHLGEYAGILLAVRTEKSSDLQNISSLTGAESRRRAQKGRCIRSVCSEQGQPQKAGYSVLRYQDDRRRPYIHFLSGRFEEKKPISKPERMIWTHTAFPIRSSFSFTGREITLFCALQRHRLLT